MELNKDLLQTLYLGTVVWLAIVTYLQFKLLRRFNRFTKGSRVDIIKLLEELQSKQGENSKTLINLSEGIISLGQIQKTNMQKQALIRFNPYEDTGGDQSFILALLDGENNGVVISSLHSRESTRVYAKPVVKGTATSHKFSKEEKEVVEKAARQS